MSKTVNPFEKYSSVSESIFIKALDANVTVRKLTMKENDAFNRRLLKDYKGSGDTVIDIEEATQISYEKVALALIEPKMTVEDLQNLNTGSAKAISEIAKYVDGTADTIIDKEGNSNG